MPQLFWIYKLKIYLNYGLKGQEVYVVYSIKRPFSFPLFLFLLFLNMIIQDIYSKNCFFVVMFLFVCLFVCLFVYLVVLFSVYVLAIVVIFTCVILVFHVYKCLCVYLCIYVFLFYILLYLCYFFVILPSMSVFIQVVLRYHQFGADALTNIFHILSFKNNLQQQLMGSVTKLFILDVCRSR